MKMDKELISTIENSEVWKQATRAMNGVIDQCNKEGHKMTEKESNELRELRALCTLALDEEVKDKYIKGLYEQHFKKGVQS